MKQKIKFKALSYGGGIISFTREMDCPDNMTESQIITWLDEQDKGNILTERNLEAIISYQVEKTTNISVLEQLKRLALNDQLMLDFTAVYNEIRPQLEGESVENQVKTVLSHMEIGYAAATNAYQGITKILQSQQSVGELNLKELRDKK